MKLRTLPLTLLATPGPLARIYVALLRNAGCRAERIVLVTPRGGGIFGRFWRRAQAEARALHWPRRIRAEHPALYQAIVAEFETNFDEMLGPFDWSRHAVKFIARECSSLDDPALQGWIKESSNAILYSGSRIVPRSLLDAGRFLHVHPGVLPLVRGADGLLWSLHLRGAVGMSAFYLAPSIDTGDLVATAEYAAPRIVLDDAPLPPDDILYRALFSFIDPLLRARFLVTRVLPLGDDWNDLPSLPQDTAAGATYTFMEHAERNRVLATLFRARSSLPATSGYASA